MFGRRGFLTLLLLMLVAASSAVDAGSPRDGSPRDSVLYRSLIGRNETIRFRTLNRIGTDPAARRAALDDLVAAAQCHVEETTPDELVRPSTVALVNLIGEIDAPESEALLTELLDAPHLGIAMVSADVLGRNKIFAAIDALKKQTNRPEYHSMYAFRFNLIRSLTQMEHPDAIEFLAVLKDAIDGQLRFHVDKVLEEVTVDHFQGDQERFAEFREPTPKQKEDQRESIFKEANYEPESLARMRLKPQQYYGIDIHARRLMFIIDHSGSMKDYWGGMSRLDRAKTELTRAITELPGEAEFAIVFYHTSVRYWRNELVPATEDNKREAISFIRRLGYGDKTNTYGALRYSLEFDDQLEAVFLLTDGRPTIGEIVSKPAIITDILHRNRFRHLNFNTIGIAVDGSTRAFLQQLAAQSSGEFREAM